MSFAVRSTLRKSLETSLSVKGVSITALFFALALIQDIALSSINIPLIGSMSLGLTGLTLEPGFLSYALLTIASAGQLIATVLAIRLFLGEKLSLKILDGQILSKAVLLFFLGLVTTSAIAIGSLLFLIPGLLLASGLFFYPVLVVEGEGKKSLRLSWDLSSGHKTNILALMTVLLVLTTFPSFALEQMGGRFSALLTTSFETVFGLSALVVAYKEVKEDE